MLQKLGASHVKGKSLGLLRTSNFFSSSSSRERFDIVIVGGGLVGSAIAAALGKTNYLECKGVDMYSEKILTCQSCWMKTASEELRCKICILRGKLSAIFVEPIINKGECAEHLRTGILAPKGAS